MADVIAPREKQRRGPAMVGAVRRAVERALAGGDGAALTIAGIAAEAGVHPTSIYRRWGTLDQLVVEVRQYKLTRSRPLPHSGDAIADLHAWAEELSDHLGEPANLELLRGGIALAGREGDCTAQWRDELQEILRADGHGPTTETRLTCDMIVGAIVYRVVFGTPLTSAELRAVVLHALRELE